MVTLLHLPFHSLSPLVFFLEQLEHPVVLGNTKTSRWTAFTSPNEEDEDEVRTNVLEQVLLPVLSSKAGVDIIIVEVLISVCL